MSYFGLLVPPPVDVPLPSSAADGAAVRDGTVLPFLELGPITTFLLCSPLRFHYVSIIFPTAFFYFLSLSPPPK